MAPVEMLFMFLRMFKGPLEGSFGVAHVRQKFGVCRGAVINVF